MCRKSHGAAFATFGVVRLKDFKFTSGDSLLKRFKAKNGTIRSFCNNCGSSLFFQGSENQEVIDVALGVMDDDPEVSPEANIYTAHKANWVEISDSLPAYTEEHDLA